MSIPVFIPILSGLTLISLGNISCVNDLLKAIWWQENLQFEDHAVRFSQLSLRSLVSDHLQDIPAQT
jgi:hypothetical protein